MDVGECLNYIGEKMLLAIFAWGIGKAGQRRMRRKLGSWIGITGLNIGRRKRCITRNIARRKLNVKCVSARLGNVIGQDIWGVGSICWGSVAEKLVMMGGRGEDDTKGRARLLPTYYIYIYYFFHFWGLTCFDMPPFWLQLWRVSTVTLWQGYGLGMSVFGSKIEWPLVRGVKLDWGWFACVHVYIYTYFDYLLFTCICWFTYIYWLFVYTDVGYLHAYRCWLLTYMHIYICILVDLEVLYKFAVLDCL